jgi:ABC-2 type transport system permease protein
VVGLAALTVDELGVDRAVGRRGDRRGGALIGIFAGGAVFDRTGERLMEFAEST